MSDEHFMRLALAQAHLALEHDDVPIGAVAVAHGQAIASAHNERELRKDPTAHAEILLLQRAAQELGRRYLDDVDVYVTLEPCPMCAGAMVAARVSKLIYGAADPAAGAAYSLYNIVADPRLNHRCEIKAGVLEVECGELLQSFFRPKRRSL